MKRQNKKAGTEIKNVPTLFYRVKTLSLPNKSLYGAVVQSVFNPDNKHQ
jgi:hypothetical protein